MKTLEMTGPGGREVLQYAERDEPRPGPAQVTVAVEHVGLNFADVLARRGIPGYATGRPSAPGLEVSGTVLETGEDVEGTATGDRVVAFTVNGTGMGEVALAEANLTVRVPSRMDLAVATTVPLTWGTALGLANASHPGPGDSILVTSAAGGAGTALAATLRGHGALMIGGVGSPLKAGALADGCVPLLRGEGFVDEAKQMTAGGSFDVVFESVGGPLLESVTGALAPGAACFPTGSPAESRTRPSHPWENCGAATGR